MNRRQRRKLEALKFNERRDLLQEYRTLRVKARVQKVALLPMSFLYQTRSIIELMTLPQLRSEIEMLKKVINKTQNVPDDLQDRVKSHGV